MKALLVIVQACNPRLLSYTLEHANGFAEEVALRGVLARVRVQQDSLGPPLQVACDHARAAHALHRRGVLPTREHGVMVLRSDYENRDIYDTVGACDLWRKHDATPTILAYTQGGPLKPNGYLYLAPTVALVQGAWTLPGVAPLWLSIDPDRARSQQENGPCLVS